MKKFYLTLLLTCALIAVATDYKPVELSKEHKHDKWDIQPKDKVKKFRAFTVSFDGKDQNIMTGQPEWVAYHIKKSPELKKSPKRPSRWIEDEDLKYVAPDDNTYKNSGYSRGHLCMKHIAWRLGANADWNTHTTLNACPQIQKFNAGIWLDMEVKTQKWADMHDDVWIICGPAWDKEKEVKYIGDGKEMKIPVPHYFWKIVVKEVAGRLDTLCLLYPHKEDIPKKRSGKNKWTHEDYLISIDKLEVLTGLDFFTKLEDRQEEAMERLTATKIWKW